MGHGRKVFFRFFWYCNKLSEKQIGEKPFSKEKDLCFWKKKNRQPTLSFVFCGKLVRGCQNCNLRSLGRFWVKTLVETLHMVLTFFVLWPRKKDLRRIVLIMVTTTAIRASRGIVWGKYFFLQTFQFLL